MPKAAKKSLPKGWTEGSVQELLGLSNEEAMIVEMRVRMAERVRKCRIARHLTQKQLADRLHSKQPHIARLEQGDASLELMMRALLVMGESTKQIARVTIEGTITDDRDQIAMLKKIRDASHVEALLVFVNSPGGTTTGGESLYLALRDVAEKKPVVAQFGTVAASAGYIVGLGTDHIVARGNTITGSVGVLAQWPEVSEMLTKLGINGMTVTEVKGFGRQKGHTEIYRGAEYSVNLLPKVKIELAVSSAQADGVVAAIRSAANTGSIGDGKIFVSPIEAMVRIRTGETAEAAL